MSRVGFLADIHVGNHGRFGGEVQAGLNRRCRDVLKVLADACERAHEVGCGDLVILGDLFDSAKPSPQEVRAVRDVLERERFNKVVLLLGNHDMTSNEPGDHAFGPLHNYEGITVVEKPTTLVMGNGAHRVELWLVPFENGDARQWLRPTLGGLSGASWPRVLCLHLGIIDGDTPPFLKTARDAIEIDVLEEVSRTYNLKSIVAGNWHERKLWADRRIMQVGALVPTGWNNSGLERYGTLAWYDTETQALGFEELPGPRFVTVRAKELRDLFIEEDLRTAAPLYVKVWAAPPDMNDARTFLDQQGIRSDLKFFYEVCPDDAEAKIAARTAATTARAAETLDEALAGYVNEMSVPDGVDRQVVLGRSRQYLGAT